MRLKGGLSIPIADMRYVNVDGDKMNGDLDMSSKNILNANINAGLITSGVLSLDRIPTPLTGKDADTVDGYHATDIMILVYASL